MVDAAIIASVRNYVRTLADEGFPVSSGLVFGSHAKGIAGQWSDIDVVVISPLFDGEIEYENIFKLWRMAARTDNRIEPIPCGERQWREDDGTPIIEIARREGVIIYPNLEDLRRTG